MFVYAIPGEDDAGEIIYGFVSGGYSMLVSLHLELDSKVLSASYRFRFLRFSFSQSEKLGMQAFPPMWCDVATRTPPHNKQHKLSLAFSHFARSQSKSSQLRSRDSERRRRRCDKRFMVSGAPLSDGRTASTQGTSGCTIMVAEYPAAWLSILKLSICMAHYT